MKNEDYFKHIKGKSFREKLLAFGDAIEATTRQSYKASECGNTESAKWYRNESRAQSDRADFLFNELIREYEEVRTNERN